VDYDRDRAADFALALMYLELHDSNRAWKGYPWDVLDVLHERRLIADPKNRAKSVVLTEQGLEQAAALFEELLGSNSPRLRSPKRGTAKESSGRSNALSDVQRMQVDKLFSPICQPHPDPKVSSLLRHGYRTEGRSVVLFESRPAFQKPHEWREHPVAKFKFIKSRRVWLLFCVYRDLNWHVYEPLPESTELAALVSEVKKDPTGIFWG
jgi:hypothetical protein